MGWPLIEGGTLKRFLWAPVLVLALAGCGGPAKDATYESASKLREAVVASGVECPGDASDKSDSGDEDFLKCSSDLGLHVFKTDDAMITGKVMTGFTKTPSLQGPRWLIQSEDESMLAKIKDKLGGSVVVP
ncbi:hypothetical protein [Pseudarthrobacter cellobiosi]|uniref:hypothetical protein n=1 Tax=Pseudarthrobacter cellobiosi TaxID=2953654 RepID=UPI00208F4D5C|nr:hypothetical protein [Pseudarthrobacter sp. HLT1-5]MCO4257345.1 hypothetical protein [Pseudarthrobacter sp. HLT1-5]